MEEGDALSVGSDPRDLVHQGHARSAALREHRVEVVYGEAQVVNARTALFNEARNRRVGTVGLEQFDEDVASDESANTRTIAVGERLVGESEDVTKKRERVGQRTHRQT